MPEPIDEAKKKQNPFAICKASQNKHGFGDKKLESCIMKVKKKAGYHESADPVEEIAGMIEEEEFAGAASAPMASKVVPFVFEHLTQLNDETIKFERMEGNTVLFQVMFDGKIHQYKMTVDYAGSTKSEQPMGEAY